VPDVLMDDGRLDEFERAPGWYGFNSEKEERPSQLGNASPH